MKHKKTIAIIVCVFSFLPGLYAQESAATAGGEASGNGGTVSYSVGQVAYSTPSGTAGSEAQGVQQPFEISISTGMDQITIPLEMSVYPNPTADFLILETGDAAGLSYRLFDVQGRLIERSDLVDTTTRLRMEELPPAIYTLSIHRNNLLLRSFSIAKH